MDAARRAGMSLREWLDETWRLHANEIRASVDDLDDDERAYAVARRLARKRAPAAGSRRSDRQSANRRAPARDADDRIWSRIDRAMDDMDDAREPRPRSRGYSEREDFSWREAADERPRPARRRLSIDEAIEDIAERQSELDFAVAGPRRRREREREPEREQTGQTGSHSLKRELSKLADRLADLQRGAAESVSAADIGSLRADVAHIARGLSALAPRESVEQIEAAVATLARKLNDARANGMADDFVAPVETMIADLKRSIIGSAPTAALEAIERRLGALTRNVEALAEVRVEPDAIANLLEHSNDIRQMLAAAAANRPNVEGVEKRIADLGARIDRILERGQTNAGLDAVTQSVAQIRADLEQQNPLKAIKALDGRIDALARKIDEAASKTDVDDHFHKLGKRLDAMHRDLAERAPEARRLEEMFQALQARIDHARNAPGPVEMNDLVSQLMARLDQAVHAGADPATVAQLEDQITRVASRIDARAAHAQASDLSRIESVLGVIARRLDNPAPIAAAEQVEGTVRLLIERFEKTLRNGVDRESLGAIERRLGEMAERLEAPITAELDTARLEAMIQDLAARVGDPGAAPSDVKEIKQALASLADRMDASLRGEADPMASRALEEQIAKLTARMDKSNGGGFSSIERSIGDIQKQLERLNATIDSSAPENIEREIADLRSLHATTDRQTHATLNAVHETLEKVVDRLAMLEDEIDAGPRTRAPARQAAAAPRADDFDDYKPSIELNFGPAEPISEAVQPTQVAPAYAPPPPSPVEEPRRAPPILAERASEPPVARRPEMPGAAPKLNAGPGDDFLLAPGSGKPSPRVVAAALQNQQASPAAPQPVAASTPSAVDAPRLETVTEPAPATQPAPDADIEGGDAHTNFIAAVRRAQTAAGAAPAPTTGNQLLEEARARARAAAAQAETQQAKSSGGGPFGLGKLFSGRKKTTVAGLTGVVALLGALQGANMFYQADKERAARIADASTRQSPAQSPQKTAARATEPSIGSLAMSPNQLADMTPVASLPVNATPSRPASEPAKPSDPFALAAAGNAQAQFELGSRFADGRHGPRDASKAIDWLSKSAAQNYAPAQYRLAVIYEKGLGAPRDAERARTLYRAAAERGNVKAMHNLGALLADGGAEGKPDYAGAAQWFRRASEHGVRDSQYNLAILSARGLGMTQDLVESHVWFSAAAAQGDTDAAAKLKEVASRLDAAQLSRAQAMAKAFRVKQTDPLVNDPPEPAGGWAVAPEAPAAAPAKPTASRSPKVSSLQAR
jgi:localization factor PodJL